MTRRYRTLLTADLLTRRYVEDEATVVEIAAETGTSAHAVYNALKRHSIALRGVRRPRRVDYSGMLTAAFLRDAYTAQRLSLEDIAADVGCTPTTVLRWLRRHGIEVRPARALKPLVYTDLNVDAEVPPGDVVTATGAARSTVNNAYRRAGIQRRPGPPRMELDTDRIDAFHAQGWTQQAIADAVGCSPGLIWKHLHGRRAPTGPAHSRVR